MRNKEAGKYFMLVSHQKSRINNIGAKLIATNHLEGIDNFHPFDVEEREELPERQTIYDTNVTNEINAENCA